MPKVSQLISFILVMPVWQLDAFTPNYVVSSGPADTFRCRISDLHHGVEASRLSTTSLPMHNQKSSSSRSSRSNNNNTRKKRNGSASSAGKGFASNNMLLSRGVTDDNFPYVGSVRPGRQSPQRVVRDAKIVLPDYAIDGRPRKGREPLLPWVIEVKTPAEIEKMRASGKLARDILDMAGRAVAPGVTTDEIDTLVHESIVAAGAYPSPLNYHGKRTIQVSLSCPTVLSCSNTLCCFFLRNFHHI